MKKLGLFAGGFKPFTSGHFAKLALASQENDFVLLFYGLSKRQKGSEFVYTEEMARKIFEITKLSIENNVRNVSVVEAKPSPIAMVFSVVAQIFLKKDYKNLENLNFSIKDFEKITIYTDELDAHENYLKYVGTPKEKLYFGEAYAEGNLKFDYGLDQNGSYERLIKAINKYGSKNLNESHVVIRGSQIRSMIDLRNIGQLNEFLPPIFTDLEKNNITNILIENKF
jgi:nicotinamide mononucleotide adenylyltransferase